MDIKVYVDRNVCEMAKLNCDINSINELQELINEDGVFEQCGDFEETCGEVLIVEYEVDGILYELDNDGKLVKKVYNDSL